MDPQASSPSEATNDEITGVPWTVIDILWGITSILVLLALFVLGVLALWAVVPNLVSQYRMGVLVLTTIFVEGLLFQVAWQFTIVKYRCHWGLLGFRSVSPIVGFLLVWAVVLAGFATNIVYAALAPLLRIDFLLPPPFSKVFSGPEAVSWAVIALAVLVVPVAEEVFFRGFVFTGLSRSHGLRWGALGSSTLFALIHFNLGAFVPILILGLLLTWLYVKSQSIWPCIIAHVIFNAAGLMTPFALSRV